MVMNAQRTREDQKVWTWRDFFSDPRPTQPQSAEEIGAAFDALGAVVEEIKNAKSR